MTAYQVSTMTQIISIIRLNVSYLLYFLTLIVSRVIKISRLIHCLKVCEIMLSDLNQAFLQQSLFHPHSTRIDLNIQQ